MAAKHGKQSEEGSSAPSRRTPCDPPVREPGAYALTDHFRQRLRQQGRYVSLPVVSETIVRGQLRWNSTAGWRFSLVDDGIRFTVVVGDTETPSPVVVTGWTEVESWSAAMGSPRWTANDVHTIQLRADLSANRNERIPSLIRPRDVDRPFEVGGHRIATDAGAGYVECVDCGRRFRSKAALCGRRCYGAVSPTEPVSD
ncbi:hypothetical protein [Halegenticoccus tardaugens]|uniref:hypothetical protein n=1 Tax=Halegenticoccus tardaugens TaxID=2071624 RepID=UPI001E5E9007|nr:hypothetical protein [Halegenticoccus tardaugens]